MDCVTNCTYLYTNLTSKKYLSPYFISPHLPLPPPPPTTLQVNRNKTPHLLTTAAINYNNYFCIVAYNCRNEILSVLLSVINCMMKE